MKLGFNDKEQRERAEFFLKYTLLGVSAIWILMTGTAYIDKRNKTLSLDSIPNADTYINRYAPQSERYLENRQGQPYCEISGQYSIRNSGKLAFVIDEVRFEVRRMPNLPPPNDGKAGSFSVIPRLDKTELVYGQPSIPVGERFGPENEMQMNYGIFVPLKADDARYKYFIVANASGGLPEEGRLSRFWTWAFGASAYTRFGKNDLRHFSAVMPLCTARPTPTPQPGKPAPTG